MRADPCQARARALALESRGRRRAAGSDPRRSRKRRGARAAGRPHVPKLKDRNLILDSLLACDWRKLPGNQGTGSKPPRHQLPTGTKSATAAPE
jgi:hypothetical protein